MNSESSARILPEEDLREAMAAMRVTGIFFGHQSVGANIIQGLQEIADELKMEAPEITEGRLAPAQKTSGLYHAGIGTNGKPLEKIEDFDRIMRDRMASRVDIAFMKLCYADITGATDVEALFAFYRKTLSALGEDFPEVRFVHVTVPLTAPGIRDRIKSLIGMPTDSREGNIQRERYNSLIRNEFGKREALFDLALFESQPRQGKRTKRTFRGRPYYQLCPEYTDDNGHLNHAGRRYISGELAMLLSSLTERPHNK